MRIAELVLVVAVFAGSASGAASRSTSLPVNGIVVSFDQKGFVVSSLDGSEKHALTAPADRGSFPDLSIAPDGASLAFTRSPSQKGASGLFVQSLVDGHVTRLASAAGLGGGIFGRPVWSADSGSVAVHRFRSRCGRQTAQDVALYVVAADGSGMQRLRALPAGVVPTKRNPVFLEAASWAPDGRLAYFVERWPVPECLYTSGIPPKPLYALNPAGGARQRLAAGFERVAWPRWSPAGDALAFASQKSSDCRLYISDASGTRALATVDSRVSGCREWDEPTFTWSQAGDEIYLGRGRQVVAVDIQSRRTRVVGTDPYPPSYCPGGCNIPTHACCEMQFLSLSSDGAYLLVQARPNEVRNVSDEPEFYFLLATHGGRAWRLSARLVGVARQLD